VGGTILILHSCPSADDQWCNELEELGYTVLTAEEPGQGMVHVRMGVDIVILDSASPELQDDVSHFVSALADEPEAPPFILVSSSPSAPTDSARLGAAAFLPKPCCAGDLDHVLAKMSSYRARVAVG
jgi:DNA-binding NtrC family response regulator